MLTTIIISLCTILLLVTMIIVKPSIRIKKLELQTFWMVPIIGVIFLFIFSKVDLKTVGQSFINDSAINPIKILVLFLSISFLSIVLDEAGFFQRCALYTTRVTKGSQKKLFLSIAIIVSILTIFTSNDIVILTFTPFICYFSKHAKINPIPYLVGEFIFANTWSMMLIIGNPTNIYLAQSYNIAFFSYFSVMVIPTIVVGVMAFLLLMLIFRKPLSIPLESDSIEILPTGINKFVTIIGLIHLGLCTILLAIASYIQIEMWLIAMIFALSLIVILLIYLIKEQDFILLHAIKRLPWSLIPFIICMFIIVLSLESQGVIVEISNLFDKFATNKVSTTYGYGFTAFIACNILNNIPMSVMFERIIYNSNQLFINQSIYATIMASNLGSYLTPIGALAGIMWMDVLKKANVKFKFFDFVKYGILISPLLILIGLSVLMLFC